MSALSENGRSNFLVTVMFPDDMSFANQVQLEIKIQSLLAKAIHSEFPDIHFAVAPEDLIAEKLQNLNMTESHQ